MSTTRPASGTASRRPHPAVAERRRSVARQQGRRRRSGALLLLGTAAAVALLYWLMTGPLLGVTEVRVDGYDRPDRAELISAIDRAAGEGTILAPSTAEMREAAAAFPWVESITVARTWPRGLAVDVQQAVPVAVAASGDRAVLVAADGRVLEERDGAAGVGWMLLPEEPPAVGATLPEGARAALAFIAATDPAVGKRIRALTTDRDGALTGRLDGGPRLRLGPPERLAAKASALALVLEDLTQADEQGASYIDLTFPERPALGPPI